MMDETVVVARVATSIEAELLVGLLKSSGIRAWASADDAGGLAPQFQLTAGVRVLVPEDEFLKAHRLVSSQTYRDDG